MRLGTETMTTPEISIVLPVYNGEECLEETLNSILNQSFCDFELICVDDGSTDGTPRILEQAQNTDNRIVICRQENMGPGASRNHGLDLAKGNYVIMLDADDIYDCNLLKKLYTSARKNQSDIVVCRSDEMDDSTQKINPAWWTLNINQIPASEPFSACDMPDFAFSAFIGWPWDKLYRRQFVEDHKLRFPELSNSEDLFFIFLSIVKAERISIVDEILIHHRINRAGSVSGSRAKAPLDFYRSTCLLKDALKRDGLYETFSWGFLNWAFQYMVWNIETMTDADARAAQLKALANDGFPELEIGIHSPGFFSLDTSIYGRYLALLSESEENPSRSISREHHSGPRMSRRIIGAIYRYGFIGCIKQLLNRVISSEHQVEPPQMKRGSDFCITKLTNSANCDMKE